MSPLWELEIWLPDREKIIASAAEQRQEEAGVAEELEEVGKLS
jgi:hypothetical protein